MALVLKGSRNDIIQTGSASDLIFAGSGNDVVSSGGGNDTVYLGSGNDTAIFVWEENRNNTNTFRGESGTDTLRIELTASEAADPDVLRDIAAFKAHLASGSNASFFFSSIRLTVSDFERLEIVAPVVAADDAAEVSEDGPAVVINVLDNDQDLLAADNSALQIVGYDASDIPSGATLVLNSDQTFSFEPGTAFDWLANGQQTTVTFTYLVEDNQGFEALGTVNLTITGSNDAPVITSQAQSGAITEIADGATGENSASHSASGAVSFADADLSDSHSAGFAAQGSGYLGSFSLDPLDQGSDSVGWSFSVDDAALDHLAAGEVLTQSYEITIDDGEGGTASQIVEVTITGSNDAPVITSQAQSGAITEIADGATGENSASHSASGAVSFADADLSDSHSAGFAAQGSGYLGSFSLDPLDQGSDSVGWSFSVDDAALDHLAAGEVLTQSYEITIDDGEGGTASQIVEVTITGSNDAPVITSQAQSGAITEIADGATGENSASHSASGTVSFADADLSDSHSAGFAAQGSGYLGSFSLDPLDQGSDSVGWSFSVDDAALDHLAAGEVLTQSYEITIDDGEGGTASQIVEVTITGSNDAPVITSQAQSGAITEIADGATGENSASHSASGAVSFADADLSDSHSAGFAAQGSGYLGSFSLDPLDQGSDSVGWSFSVDDAALDHLAAGEVLTQSYEITIDDGEGGTASQIVEVTITGSNDAPVITSQAQSGAITEIADGATGENSASHSASGAVSFADADLSDSHSAGFAAQGSGYLGSFSLDPLDQGSDSVGWSFSVDDAALDHLAAGEVLTQSYEITIDDGEGGTASQIVEVTITGSNDAPVITSQAQSGAITEIADGATGENSASHSASGAVSFADADLSDSHSAGFAAQGSGYLGSFSLDPLDQGSDSVGWSFSVDDAALDHLAAGEVLTQSYEITIDDGEGGTASQIVEVTITGSNDAPVITSQAQSGAITEIADGATGENSASHSASGTVSFADADLSDSHSAGFAAQGSGYLGSFSLDPLDQGSDSVGWSFSVDDAALDHLAAGEVLTQSYEITIDDGEGGTASQIVEVTITGSNDAPVITSQAQSGAITEIADGATGENSASHSASGAVSFADADLSDSHSAGFAAQGSGYLGSFSLDPLDQGSDSVGWSFSVDDAALDHLAAGEVLTQSYEITIDDGEGGTASQIVEVTITGSNDAPVITSQAQSGAITEIADGATGENSASHSASGAVSFADADLSDSHSAGFAAQGSGYLGSFSLDPLDQGSDSVGWSFSVDDAALDHLAAGEVLTQSYEITIDDGEGGTASQIVEVTITGSNDAPVITSQAQSGAITEIADGATGENSASHSASGAVSFADADLSDSHSAGFAAQGSGYLGSFSLDPLDQGSDSVGWSFSVDDAALDHLAAGEVLTQSYEITIDDGEGGTASQIVEVTITGSNDGPTLSAGLAVATEDGPAVVVDLSALGDDVDSDDDGTSLGYTILTQPAEGSASISGTTLTFAPGAAFQDLADGETRDVTIEVQASDAHGASATSLVTVTLTGTNDTPANLSLSGTQAPENVPSAVIGILSADDPDSGGSLTYSILPGGDSNAFVIVGNELRVGATALDYETKPTYSLTIRATDQYGAHVDHVFQLEVVDSDEQTLTTGTDVITPGAGNTQVLGNAQTLNANDNLDGGGGIDELVLYGSGTFDLNSLAGFANFEGIRLVNLNSSSLTTLTLKNGISSNVTTSGLGTNTINVNGSTTVNAINGGDGREIIRLADSAHVAEINLGNGSSQQVYLFNAASTGTINGGSSTDSIYLQGQGTVDAVNLGAGSDTVYVFSSAAWNPALSMDGGLGNDELYFSAGVGTFDLRSASLENVEWLTVFNAELIVDDDVLAGVNLLRGGVGSSFRTDDATLDLTGISVQNAQVTSNNAAGTTFAVNSKPTAFQVYGGGGFDTIETATFAFTTDERTFIFNSSSIEQIIDTSGVYHAPPLPPETYKLTVGSDTLALGATNDTVNANAQTLNSTDNLDAGAGDDILALYGSGSFNLNSLAAFAGFETVRYSSDSSSNQIYLRNGTTVDVETSGIGSKTIYTGATAAIGSFTGSDGSESVWLDGTGSIDSFIGGASSDVLYVRTTSSWNDNLSMDGGTGSDTLYFYFASGTFDLRGATLQSVETIRAIGTVTLLVDDATLSDVSAILGSSALAIQTDASSLDLSGITVQNAQVTSANASGTVFTINSKPTAFQVFGGAGQDAITTSAFAFTSDEREIIFASSSVEQITDASGTYNAPPPAANTYVLTTSADTLALGGTDDTVNANAQTLNSTDDLDAGAGNDVLALYGNGSYNLNGLTGFANFEEVRVTTVSGSNSSLYLRNGTTSDVTHTGDGTLTLYVQGTAAIDQFIGGTSSAYLYFYDSSSFSSLDMGSASNSITVQDATAWNPNSSINGGASVDRLYFSAANTTFDVRNASLDSVEQIYANGTNSVVVVDTDALDDVSVLSGGTTGRFRFEETEVDLSGISISNVRVESGAVSGTSFAVNSKQAAYQIQGGIGQDAVKTASFAFTATERDFIFNASSIEVIQDTTGIYGNGVSNSLQAEAGGSIMSAGGGDDELISGAGNDTMTGGAGADQFVFAQNSGNDTITDFELGVDGLVLEAGVTIASLTETNTGGSSSLDTVVELSTGDTVVLLDVSNITDPNNLVV